MKTQPPPPNDPKPAGVSSVAQNNDGVTVQPRSPGSSARLQAIPASARFSPQLNALCQRAATGAVEDIKRLAKWSSLVENEAEMLRWRLRKQQHDFATLFEIVGQTSARSMNVDAMQTYLLRTVSGHFATAKLLIMRRMRTEDTMLTCSALQGVTNTALPIPADSPLCQLALERRFCFLLKDLPQEARNAPEVVLLNELGVHLVVPLIQDVETPGAVLEGFFFLGKRLSQNDYNEEDLEFLQILAKMLAICLRNETLYRCSIIDDLTGVASRGHFEAQLSQELNRIATYGHRSMGLVMLDVDHFKHFNDNYGHQTGDRVLQELTKVLVHQVRNVDLVARYGGEEFAIILLEIDRAKVLEVAERLRKAVEDIEVVSAQGEKLRITASFGLACFPDDATDRSMLVQLTDEALYRSKDKGRNCVTMTTPGSGLTRSVLTTPKPGAIPIPAPKSADARVISGKTGSTPSVLPSTPIRSHFETPGPELERIRREQHELAFGTQAAGNTDEENSANGERRRR